MDSLLADAFFIGRMAVKFTASTSSSTGQNPILAGKGQQRSSLVKDVKFGKTKEEKRPPSSGRGKAATDTEADAIEESQKLCDSQAIAAAAPTPEVDAELEAQVKADKKRHKAAVDGIDGTDKDEQMVKKDEHDAEVAEADFPLLLEKERQKRRDVEDNLDELKSELGWQRETLARTQHALKKVITSSLQSAERKDQVTVYVVKKKSEKARAFFEAYKDLQKLVVKEAEMLSISNNGPMLQVALAGPEFIREAMQKIKDWERRSGIEAAIFKGKTVLTQMMELPIRVAFNSMLTIMQLDSRAAREAGLNTAWLDHEKKWGIIHGDKLIIRGVCSLEELQSEVHVNMDAFKDDGAKELIGLMKQFSSRDRFGPLLELSFSQVDKFGPEVYGRQPRQGGGGKGKGKY